MLSISSNVIRKTLVLILFLGLLASAVEAEAYVRVKGYYRSDGTYVRSHVRSNPNGLKFDNYSWKPSQGLYNKTYGTRGSYWDTPTYITDPNYYEGEALYEAGKSSSHSSLFYSSGNSLKHGSYGDEVRQLQILLSGDKFLYPEGIVSGYYGTLTENAIKRFQSRHGIINYGTLETTGYGSFGPKTQAKFNEIFTEGNTNNNGPVNNPSQTPSNSNDSGLTDEYNKICNQYYGVNSHWNGTKNNRGAIECACNSGYGWNIGKTGCVSNDSPFLDKGRNGISGKDYYLKNKTCVGLGGQQYSDCLSYYFNQ